MSDSPFPARSATPGPISTDRSRVKRLPERASYDEDAINAILDAGLVAHVGFAVDSQPFVIPTLYGRDGRNLLLHGSAASRMLRQLAQGLEACVTVTLVDGLVLARSAFHHSMNYQSVVAFGRARLIEDGENKIRALETISNHVAPGRWKYVRPPSAQELKATSVLHFTIEDASAKLRSGPPKDDAGDMQWPVWAGVVPLRTVAGLPLPDGEPLAKFDSTHVRPGLAR